MPTKYENGHFPVGCYATKAQIAACKSNNTWLIDSKLKSRIFGVCVVRLPYTQITLRTGKWQRDCTTYALRVRDQRMHVRCKSRIILLCNYFCPVVVSRGKCRKRLLYYDLRNRWYGFFPKIRTLFTCFSHWHAIRCINRRLFAITLCKVPSDKIESKW